MSTETRFPELQKLAGDLQRHEHQLSHGALAGQFVLGVGRPMQTEAGTPYGLYARGDVQGGIPSALVFDVTSHLGSTAHLHQGVSFGILSLNISEKGVQPGLFVATSEKTAAQLEGTGLEAYTDKAQLVSLFRPLGIWATAAAQGDLEHTARYEQERVRIDTDPAARDAYVQALISNEPHILKENTPFTQPSSEDIAPVVGFLRNQANVTMIGRHTTHALELYSRAVNIA